LLFGFPVDESPQAMRRPATIAGLPICAHDPNVATAAKALIVR
jgi:hypothetical protein